MMDINVKKNRTLFILEMNNDKRNNMMCIKSTQTNPDVQVRSTIC